MHQIILHHDFTSGGHKMELQNAVPQGTTVPWGIYDAWCIIYSTHLGLVANILANLGTVLLSVGYHLHYYISYSNAQILVHLNFNFNLFQLVLINRKQAILGGINCRQRLT